MRLSGPRIQPVSMEDYLAHPHPGIERPIEARAVNIERTWLRYPALMEAHYVLGRHLTGPDATLPRRDRELGIMRMGVQRRCDYEFAAHRRFNLDDGLFSEAEILRIVEGADAPGWTEHEAAIIRAVDGIHDDAFIDDDTWATLAGAYTPDQLMDFLVLMGRYWMVATLLNTVGVQLEDGKEGLPSA